MILEFHCSLSFSYLAYPFFFLFLKLSDSVHLYFFLYSTSVYVIISLSFFHYLAMFVCLFLPSLFLVSLFLSSIFSLALSKPLRYLSFFFSLPYLFNPFLIIYNVFSISQARVSMEWSKIICICWFNRLNIALHIIPKGEKQSGNKNTIYPTCTQIFGFGYCRNVLH